MSKQTIEAKTRTATGKTAAKNLRKEGRIPAVVYNAKGEATSIDVNEVEFNKIWRTITPTTSIALNIDGKEVAALIKDVEYNIRTDKALHADFFAPDADQKLVMKIKIHSQGTPAGVLQGGFLVKHVPQVTLKALPKYLPESVSADIASLKIGDKFAIKDLNLDPNIKVLTKGDLLIASIAPAK